MNILKGIGAVLLGLIFIVVTHIGTDTILESLRIFPPPDKGFHVIWMLVTASIYRSIFTIGGGYVTAWAAPTPKMRYVIILAAIGLVAGIGGVVFAISQGFTDTWYPVYLAVSGPVFVWIGGKLRKKG